MLDGLLQVLEFDVSVDFRGAQVAVAEELLQVHRSYLTVLRGLIPSGAIYGMAHITGGGFTDNIPRVLPAGIGVRIDRTAWQVPTIFRLIQERGHVDEMEMYRVFNMGIGIVLLVSPEQVEQALAILQGEAVVIGQAVPWDESAPRVKIF